MRRPVYFGQNLICNPLLPAVGLHCIDQQAEIRSLVNGDVRRAPGRSKLG
jgi:hypothetical protein